MADSTEKPSWVPAQHDPHFACFVSKGVAGSHDGLPSPKKMQMPSRPRHLKKRPKLTCDSCVEGVLRGDRTLLARTITLLESTSPQHRQMAQDILTGLAPHSGKSVRIGITGVPGVGKSTFIEAFGLRLCEAGHKLAILTIDPSSPVRGGSILGDKTRMEKLSHHPNAYIRPTPSGGALGGVAARTRETMLACEAAGFDYIIVETVGVGQSEVTVRSMVDFFLFLALANAGDELQGIKKGVLELVDAIAVNKADGDNIKRARAACGDYTRVLDFLTPYTRGWEPKAVTCSAYTGDGIAEIEQSIHGFVELTRNSGFFQQRRQEQDIQRVHQLIEQRLKESFLADPKIRALLPQLEDQVARAQLPVTAAVTQLMEAFGKPQNT